MSEQSEQVEPKVDVEGFRKANRARGMSLILDSAEFAEASDLLRARVERERDEWLVASEDAFFNAWELFDEPYVKVLDAVLFMSDEEFKELLLGVEAAGDTLIELMRLERSQDGTDGYIPDDNVAGMVMVIDLMLNVANDDFLEGTPAQWRSEKSLLSHSSRFLELRIACVEVNEKLADVSFG